MHRFWGHFFDLTIITLGTSNFDLTPIVLDISSSILFIIIIYLCLGGINENLFFF